jgi:hypothetical protein
VVVVAELQQTEPQGLVAHLVAQMVEQGQTLAQDLVEHRHQQQTKDLLVVVGAVA